MIPECNGRTGQASNQYQISSHSRPERPCSTLATLLLLHCCINNMVIMTHNRMLATQRFMWSCESNFSHMQCLAFIFPISEAHCHWWPLWTTPVLKEHRVLVFLSSGVSVLWWHACTHCGRLQSWRSTVCWLSFHLVCQCCGETDACTHWSSPSQPWGLLGMSVFLKIWVHCSSLTQLQHVLLPTFLSVLILLLLSCVITILLVLLFMLRLLCDCSY
jgi:hypothetical protein